MGEIESFIEKSESAEDREQLVECFKAIVKQSFGFEIFGYFLLTDQHQSLTAFQGVRSRIFPSDFYQAYIDKREFEHDPILKEACNSSEPFHWFELEQNYPLSERERLFLAKVRALGINDGISLSVYAQPGRLAHMCFTSIGRSFPISSRQKRILRILCQELHYSYERMAPQAAVPTLSNRESQVMGLVIKGFSNAEISQSLGLSRHTIDTLIRRCFQKLSVSNRVEAAVKASSLNLVADQAKADISRQDRPAA